MNKSSQLNRRIKVLILPKLSIIFKKYGSYPLKNSLKIVDMLKKGW